MIRAVEAVCTSAVAPGLEATGLPVHRVDTAEEALARIGELRSGGEGGVVLLEADLHDELERAGRLPPAVLRLPGPAWAERPAAEEYILELLRRAVGYRVKLR